MDEPIIDVDTTYLLTQLSKLAEAVQHLTVKVDTLTTSQIAQNRVIVGAVESAQGLVDLNSEAITNESVERINADLVLDGRISDLSNTHINDKVFLVGEIEQHHADSLEATRQIVASVEAERQSREAVVTQITDQLSEAQISMEQQVHAVLDEYSTFADSLDFTTTDSDLSVDSDYELGWNILSEAQAWQVEITERASALEHLIAAKMRDVESAVVKAAEESSKALENTDISKLLDSLQGQIGIDALDGVLWGRIEELESEAERERRERIEQIQREADELATRLHAQALALHEGLLIEAHERADAMAEESARAAERAELEANERTQAIQEKADELVAQINKMADDTSDALIAKALELSNDYGLKISQLRNAILTDMANLQDGVTTSIEELKSIDASMIQSLNAYKVSNNQNIAAIQDSVRVVTDAQSSTAETVQGLTVSFTGLGKDVAKAQADIVATNKAVADGNSAMTQQIQGLNTEMGDAKAQIGEVSEAVSTLDSATTTKFEELTAELAGVDDAVAKAQKTADAAVTANTAQSSDMTALSARVTKTEGAITKKADTTALTALETKVIGNESAMTQRIDDLAASLTDLGEGVETTVDVTAFNALKGEVTNTKGVVTGHTQDISVIKGSILDVEAGVAATNEAVSGLDTEVTKQGEDISSASRSIEQLKADLDLAETAIGTKASTAALSTTNANVVKVGDRVTANTNTLNQLDSRLDTAEGMLSQKADATALNNMYTKTEADGKALEIAAGEVSKFNAGLTIGGSNLYFGPNPVVLRSQTSDGRIVFPAIASGNTQRFDYLTNDNLDLSGLQIGDPTIASIEIFVPSTDTSDYTIQFGTYRFSGSSYVYAPTVDVKTLPKDTWVKLTTAPGTYTSGQPPTGINLVFNMVGRKTAGDEIQWRNFMMEKASVASAFQEADRATQAKLDANAQAIETTDAEVSRIDGEVKSQTTSISKLTADLATTDTKAGTAVTNAAKAQTTANTAVTKADAAAKSMTELESRVGLTESGLAKKADATVLAGYYTSAKANEVIAGELTKFKSSLVIGGVNQLLNSEAERSSTASSRREYLMYENSEHLYNFFEENLGKDVTISFDLKVAVAGFVQIYCSNGTHHNYAAGIDVTAANVGKWVRYSVTVKPAKHASGANIRKSAVEFYGTYDSGRIPYVRKVQLEAGSFATDWSPSPRDVDASFKSTSEAIANTYTKAEANKAISTATNGLKSEFESGVAEQNKTISNWVERNKAEAIMVETMAAELVPHMAGNTELFADMEINVGYQGVITALADTDTATLARVDTLEANYKDANAKITATQKAVADLDSSLAQDLLELQADFKTTVDETLTPAVNNLTSKLKNEYLTIADSKTAISQATTTLKTEVTKGYTDAIGGIKLDSITIPDTRSANQLPSWYWSNYGQRKVSEFKFATTVGLTNAQVGNTYGTLTTIVPWSDSSGGPIKQVMEGATEDKIFIRYSNGVSSWTAWEQQNAKLSASIKEQSETIDGVRALKTVTIDNNGIMSGYGLVSDLVGGKVTSAFGVNADQFYVGSPATGKKVFAVVGGQTVINDAVIGNLSAAKITTGAMHGDRITAGTIKADRLAVTSLSALSANMGKFVGGNAGKDRVEIDNNGIRVYDAAGTLRGVFGKIV